MLNEYLGFYKLALLSFKGQLICRMRSLGEIMRVCVNYDNTEENVKMYT
jgi:hypothetical protein